MSVNSNLIGRETNLIKSTLLILTLTLKVMCVKFLVVINTSDRKNYTNIN